MRLIDFYPPRQNTSPGIYLFKSLNVYSAYLLRYVFSEEMGLHKIEISYVVKLNRS